MRAPANNTRVARAAKADRDARRRSLRFAAAEPRTPRARADGAIVVGAIADAISMAAETDGYIALLGRLGDSLAALAKAQFWHLPAVDDEWIELSDEEVRRLSDEWIELSDEEVRCLSDE